MPRFFLAVFLLFLSFGSYAQDKADQHFIYVQTENNQPFYIRMNGKVFSSTAGGYVILPKLSSGNYQLYAGFPKNEFPEQEFHITISGINEGFLLKKLGSGWSLFNIETMALTEGVNTIPVPVEKMEPRAPSDNDPFATLLAGAVKDSSILENDVMTVAPKTTTDTVQANITAITDPAADTSSTINSVLPPLDQNQSTGLTTNSQPASQTAPVLNPKSSKENSITRILLVNEVGGLELVYVDHSLKDTIRIFLPIASYNPPQKQTAKVIYNTPVRDTVALTITPTIIPDSAIPEKKNVQDPEDQQPENQDQIIYTPEKNTPAVANNQIKEETTTDGQKENTSQIIYNSGINSDCQDFATKKDFLRLRKRMAAETDNDKMIDVARKYFKNKCFSTEQLRNLSYLFLNDEGRYKFFDAAYPYTSDSDQYSSLESQLSDPYYINRFKAMIHK